MKMMIVVEVICSNEEMANEREKKGECPKYIIKRFD